MNGEDYETMEMEDSYSMNGAEYDHGEVDEMLDSLIDAAGGDFGEAKRGRRGRQPNRAVPTAPGRSAYREPVAGGAVTQKQFKDALDRVGGDIRRNAEGIKTINARLNALDGRVNSVVSVATLHSRQMTRFEKQMKVDGALELVEALNGTSLNAFQLLKGAVKLGFLGDGKGPMSNPAVIGGLGLFIRNPGILGSFGGLATPPVP
jgi:hypothetical protein